MKPIAAQLERHTPEYHREDAWILAFEGDIAIIRTENQQLLDVDVSNLYVTDEEINRLRENRG